MVIPRVASVHEGERIEVVQTVFVAAACTKNEGIWYCVTHKRTLLTQWDKDAHISNGSHKLAWCCMQHGYEVASAIVRAK